MTDTEPEGERPSISRRMNRRIRHLARKAPEQKEALRRKLLRQALKPKPETKDTPDA